MRIEFIDGLRGIAALGVVYIHYCTFFHPYIPIGFYNSCVMVCEFFVISGFVLSYRFWQNKNSDSLTSSSLRRYVRLTAAPLVSILVSYLLIKFSLSYHKEIFSIIFPEFVNAFFNFVPNLKDALYEGLWGMYFSYYQPTSYNMVLWTMAWELKGSILVAAFLALFGKVKKRLPLYIIFIIVSVDTLYPTFIFGVMFSDLLYSEEGKKLYDTLKQKKFLAVIALSIGIFLSIFSLNSPIDLYRNLEFEFFAQKGIDPEVFYHIISAVLIMYAVLNLEVLQKIFSWKAFTKIGEYSFSLYLIHVQILISFGGFIFLELFHRGSSLTTCIFFGSVSSLLATVPATFLLHNFVDMPAGKLAKRVQKIFE